MKIKNFFKSVSGFTIVEVMVAMGLLGAVSLGVMKVMENANKASKSIEVKDDILQLERQIADVLNTQNNCELTLGEKTINSDIPIIYQVVNNQPVAKFSVSSETLNIIQITSMKVKDVDINGGDGSTGLASLEVVFSKPSNVLGGKQIKKEIVLNANLCQKKWIQHTDLKELFKLCTNGKIVDGPNKWGGSSYWAACQDCSMANSKTIYSCQAKGGSGGVDATNMAKITCYNIGGTFDDINSSCNLRDKITQDSCYALGGMIDANGACRFNNNTQSLAEFIQDLVKKELPQCVVLPACTTNYPKQGGAYTVKTDSVANYTEYTRKCTAEYKRYWWTGGWFNLPNDKSVLCAANYSKYGTTSQTCDIVSRNASATCHLADWILGCTGCGTGCFQKTSYGCTPLSDAQKTETVVGTATLYNCCR